MIELIYGEDDVGVEDALNEILRNAGPEDLRDINTTVLRNEDLTPEALESAAFTIPFMADTRVVAVKGLMSRFERGGRRGGAAAAGRRQPGLGEWADLAERLPSIPPSTHLALADGAVARNNPLFRKLAPVARTREFPLPRDRDMPGWIANRAKTLGVDIEGAAVRVLADATGRQPRLIDSELRKLALYANGRRARVADVELIVAYVREANIFQAVDAVIDGKTDAALRLVRKIMEDGSPAVYVLTMLARQARLLLIANDMLSRGAPQEEISAQLRLSGWVLNKTLQQARRLSAEYLRYFHAQLVETDLALKTRPIEERLALETLVADLTMRR